MLAYHHNVIIAVIVIITMMTLCYSLMLHATPIILCHASNINTTKLLHSTCTLVAISRRFNNRLKSIQNYYEFQLNNVFLISWYLYSAIRNLAQR